jgi:hypothetical protein
VLAIWKIDNKINGKCVQVLEKGLKEEEASDVLATLEIVAELGPAAKKAAPALVPLLKHSDKMIRSAAAGLLQKLDPQLSPK